VRRASRFVVASCILMGACRADRQPARQAVPVPAASASAPAAAESLHPVPAPNVARLSASARQQLEQAYATLQSTVARADASPLERGAAYGDMGKLFLAAGDGESAEAALRNAQLLAPGEMRWPYYLAQRFRSEGDPARAAPFFARALELRPEHAPTLVWLGDTYLALGRPEAAEPLFRRALAIDPTLAAAIAGLGRAALAARDYTAAADHLERALRLAPTASAVHYPLAMAYRGLGDTAKAEAHLRRRGDVDVGMRDPLMEDVAGLLHSAMSYEMSGRQALIAGRFPEAAADFRKGIALASDNPTLQADLRHKLGTALFQMGNPRGGMEQFELALVRAPEFAPAHYSLGVVMLATGRTAAAIEHLSSAVKSEPSYVDARLRLGDALLVAGHPDTSLLEYQHALEIDSRGAEAQFGCAMALAALGRFAEARDRLAAGMEAHPEQPLFARTLVRLLAGAPDERVRDPQRALRLVQQWPGAATSGADRDVVRDADRDEAMAMVLAALGQFDDAVMWQRAALEAAGPARDPARMSYLSRNLALYRRHLPSRAPWLAAPRYTDSAAPPAQDGGPHG
jgi:tetratricopeptide (TPR) repeat protein